MNINELFEYAELRKEEYPECVAILELIAAYRKTVAALKLVEARSKSHEAYRVAVQTLATAKRLGVE